MLLNSEHGKLETYLYEVWKLKVKASVDEK